MGHHHHRRGIVAGGKEERRGGPSGTAKCVIDRPMRPASSIQTDRTMASIAKKATAARTLAPCPVAQCQT
jgi:hypothetical protein